MLRLPIALLVLPMLGCACPDLVEAPATPLETLGNWQAHLCRDDPQGEYGCLAASFQRAMGGFENYHAARRALLEQHPLTAWLLQRADLAQAVTETSYAPDGNAAWLLLEARGEPVLVRFEREAWVTLAFADGSRVVARQPRPMTELLPPQDSRPAARQAVLVEKPALTAEQWATVRSIHVDSRWQIADLAGLAAGAATGTVTGTGADP